MAKFDRNQFKTSNSLAQQEKEISHLTNHNNGSRTKFIELKEDGEYLIRIWPNPTKDSYPMLPHKTHFLEVEKDKYQDGEVVTDKDGNTVKEVKNSPVFNSIVHGDTPKDIIEEYISTVNKLADEKYEGNKSGKKDHLKHVYGYRQGQKYVGGITGNFEYVAYGSLLKKNSDGGYIEVQFGRVKIKQTVRTQILTLFSSEDEKDGIQTDALSDPDDGFILKIVKDSVAGKKDPKNYYTTSWLTKDYVPIKWPLPEGFEAKFDEMPTLDELYKGVYNAKTFQMALEGLQRFDAEHKYNVFSVEEFLDVCEEIAAYYPDEEDEESGEEEEKETKKEAPKQKSSTVTKPKVNSAPKKDPDPVEDEIEEAEEAEEEEESDLPFDKKEGDSSKQDAMKARIAAMRAKTKKK